MMGKKEILDRIKSLDLQIKRMANKGQKGKKLDALCMEVIDLESYYEENYGYDPCKQLK